MMGLYLAFFSVAVCRFDSDREDFLLFNMNRKYVNAFEHKRLAHA